MGPKCLQESQEKDGNHLTHMIPIFYHHHTSHFDSEVVGNQNHLKKEHAAPVEDKPARWYRDFFIQRSQKDKVWHCFSIMFTEHVLPISQNDATVPFHSPTTTKEKGCQAHQHLK